MTLITDKPEDLESSNDLDNIQIDDDGTPPAYLAFGLSPSALDDPPAVGEIRTYIVRARCTGEHGPIERKDGEMRYTRTLQIQAAWESGKKPQAADDEQPGLFDETGEDEDSFGDSDHTNNRATNLAYGTPSDRIACRARYEKKVGKSVA